MRLIAVKVHWYFQGFILQGPKFECCTGKCENFGGISHPHTSMFGIQINERLVSVALLWYPAIIPKLEIRVWHSMTLTTSGKKSNDNIELLNINPWIFFYFEYLRMIMMVSVFVHVSSAKILFSENEHDILGS